jgi:hypothetical protein
LVHGAVSSRTAQRTINGLWQLYHRVLVIGEPNDLDKADVRYPHHDSPGASHAAPWMWSL